VPSMVRRGSRVPVPSPALLSVGQREPARLYAARNVDRPLRENGMAVPARGRVYYQSMELLTLLVSEAGSNIVVHPRAGLARQTGSTTATMLGW
jgi:hypothetical protein